MASRRGKGTLVPSKDSPNKDTQAFTTHIKTIDLSEAVPKEDTHLLAIKLNRNTDKVTRFESHKEYLMACVKDKLIPTNFKIELEPSISNHDNTFLDTWYEKIQNLSLDLMKDTVKFCEKTITKARTEIKILEDEYKNQTDQEEYNEIHITIAKYNDQKIRELQKTKVEKHRKLKWNPAPKQTQQSRSKAFNTHTSNNQRSYYQSDASNPTTEIVKTHRDKPSQTRW